MRKIVLFLWSVIFFFGVSVFSVSAEIRDYAEEIDSYRVSIDILKDAAERDAKAIIVACPMCQSNLDMRRGAINETLSNPSDIPVLFITQAIGLALGLSPKELGLERHFVNVKL